jgi:hypothetical protein
MAPILLALAAIGVVAFLLHEAWQKNFGGIQEKTKAVVEFLYGLFDGVGTFLGILGKGAERLAPVFIGAFEWIKDRSAGSSTSCSMPSRCYRRSASCRRACR